MGKCVVTGPQRSEAKVMIASDRTMAEDAGGRSRTLNISDIWGGSDRVSLVIGGGAGFGNSNGYVRVSIYNGSGKELWSGTIENSFFAFGQWAFLAEKASDGTAKMYSATGSLLGEGAYRITLGGYRLPDGRYTVTKTG